VTAASPDTHDALHWLPTMEVLNCPNRKITIGPIAGNSETYLSGCFETAL